LIALEYGEISMRQFNEAVISPELLRQKQDWELPFLVQTNKLSDTYVMNVAYEAIRRGNEDPKKKIFSG